MDKDRANFCEYFSIDEGGRGTDRTAEEAEARARLDALFRAGRKSR